MSRITHIHAYIYIFHLRYLQKRADISDSNCLGSCIFFLFSVLHCLGLGLCHASQLLSSLSRQVSGIWVLPLIAHLPLLSTSLISHALSIIFRLRRLRVICRSVSSSIFSN